eukprot:TRINITY_DN33528_c0_g1_i1.p1 TRINITY_DN33528_c0_g1~~TRINITY_DN33528_c0_g1_i1.p1  ORF type:complete len:618 (+),score=78.05 TRINITY_DN33528_c0_g1_i1:111-1964(+)
MTKPLFLLAQKEDGSRLTAPVDVGVQYKDHWLPEIVSLIEALSNEIHKHVTKGEVEVTKGEVEVVSTGEKLDLFALFNFKNAGTFGGCPRQSSCSLNAFLREEGPFLMHNLTYAEGLHISQRLVSCDLLLLVETFDAGNFLVKSRLAGLEVEQQEATKPPALSAATIEWFQDLHLPQAEMNKADIRKEKQRHFAYHRFSHASDPRQHRNAGALPVLSKDDQKTYSTRCKKGVREILNAFEMQITGCASSSSRVKPRDLRTGRLENDYTIVFLAEVDRIAPQNRGFFLLVDIGSGTLVSTVAKVRADEMSTITCRTELKVNHPKTTQQKFIKNVTSGCPVLGLLMCNLGGVRLGDLVLDPFFGTGGLFRVAKRLLANSYSHGSEKARLSGFASFTVLGTDVKVGNSFAEEEYLRISGSSSGTSSNETDVVQLGMKSRDCCIRANVFHPPFRHTTPAWCDVVIFDPPFGLREAVCDSAHNNVVSGFASSSVPEQSAGSIFQGQKNDSRCYARDHTPENLLRLVTTMIQPTLYLTARLQCRRVVYLLPVYESQQDLGLWWLVGQPEAGAPETEEEERMLTQLLPKQEGLRLVSCRRAKCRSKTMARLVVVMEVYLGRGMR